MSIGKGIAIAAIWIGPSIAIAITGRPEMATVYAALMLATVILCIYE